MGGFQEIAFRGRDWRTIPLGMSRIAEVEELVDQCADYFRLVIGRDPDAGDARGVLQAVPPGRHEKDKHVLGIAAPDGELIGLLDLVDGYRSEDEWWIGLLLLKPIVRNRNLGGEVLSALETCARFRGVSALGLGVVDENKAAARFLERVGFRATGETVEREIETKRHRVHIYRKSLAED